MPRLHEFDLSSKIIVVAIILFTIQISFFFSPLNTYAFSSQNSDCTAKTSLNALCFNKITIGIVKPSFTIAAYGQQRPADQGSQYSTSFYNFYKPYYNKLDLGLNVTTDIEQLTVKISPTAKSLKEKDLPVYMRDMPNDIEKLFPNSNISFLNDENIHDGIIFRNNNQNLTNAYDILILYHEEYVTQQEYNNLKQFVLNGGILIILDANIFYGEVKLDKSNQLLTLVEGHGVKFDGKVAIKSVRERWENETKEWVGSNFYEFASPKNRPIFSNNPFNYTAIEEQYINNDNAKVILNYGSSDPRYTISTYEMNYGKGKVIVLGIFSSALSKNSQFKDFLNELIINYAIPTDLKSKYSPLSDDLFDIPPLLQFSSVDANANKSMLTQINNGSSVIPFYRVQGYFSNNTVKFESQPLDYSGKNISLTIGTSLKYGNFLKDSTEARIYFDCELRGEKGNYHLIIVHGRPISEGWEGNKYYKIIDTHSTISIDGSELLKKHNDVYKSLQRISVIMEPNIVINPLEFRFNFYDQDTTFSPKGLDSGIQKELAITSNSHFLNNSIQVGNHPYGVTYNPLNGNIYVANYDSNTVSVIDGKTNKVTATIPVGENPRHIAFDSLNGNLYAMNYDSNAVSVIDGKTNKVTATIPVGLGPAGAAYNPNTRNLYVANNPFTNGKNTLSIIDTLAGRVIKTMNAGPLPWGAAFSPINGDIYITNQNTNSVTVINGTTNKVTDTISVGSDPIGITVNPNNGKIYVTNHEGINAGTVSIINGTTNQVTATVPIGSQPVAVTINPNNNDVYVTDQVPITVSIIDGTTNKVTTTIPVRSGPAGAAYNPNTDSLYVSSYNTNTVFVIPNISDQKE